MCGIAGIVGPGYAAELEAACTRMVSAQMHRGPDDGGVVALPGWDPLTHAVLGARRLAVIDLSASGHQPMADESGTVWVVYNGEIYNFSTLRQELQLKGYRFRSNTDTEVILRAYEAYGDACVERFRGMFAFAIWDGRRRRLLLGRDRLGEKPLYTAWDGRRLIFASELRALLASGLIERRLNPSAVHGYLAFGAVPAPVTILEGVESLGPGCLMSFEDGRVSTRSYWDVTFNERQTLEEPEAVEALRSHLRDAVRLRLVSDVPLGAFLSGGLDSSTIVALMREAGVGRLRTFSLTFDQPEFDEAPFARLVAERFETDHTEHRVTASEVLHELDRILAAMDQPSVDGLNTYMVSKLTRSSGTVVALSGLGGDELFGGYSSFWHVPRLWRLGRVLDRIAGARQAAGVAVGWCARGGRGQKLRAFLQGRPSPERAYLTVKGLLLGEALDAVNPAGAADPDAFHPLAYLETIAGGHTESLLNRVTRLELRTYLHNQLLRDADAMSMAHAVEVRVPLLDHVLIEFLATVPTAVKFGDRPKHLLVQAVEGLLPREIVERSKGSFTFPLERWMRQEWRAAVEQRLLDGDAHAAAGLDHRALSGLWREFLAGRVSWLRVWAIVALEAWVERHLGDLGAPAAMSEAGAGASSAADGVFDSARRGV